MVYKIFTAIVFIAEIIIAYTIFSKLVMLDKLILKADKVLTYSKLSLKEISRLISQISAQCVEFAEDFALDFKTKRDEIALKQLNKLILTIILIKMNSNFINRIRRSKLVKRISRGLSLLQLVI